MIVITGATGALNGATVEHLLQRLPADQNAAIFSTSSQSKAMLPILAVMASS